jgi:F0F1-type ATP synthase gamma subunit
VGQDGEVTEKPKKELLVAMTSDRGLCGAVHSSICRAIKAELNSRSTVENVGIICVGDKSRAQLQKCVNLSGAGGRGRVIYIDI